MTDTPHTPVVAISGASSGIGKALAETYAKKGYRLSLFARREEVLHQLSQELTNTYGTPVHYSVGNVGEKIDCKRWIDETVNAFSDIHILINNAGISMRATLEEAEVEVIEQVMQTNFFGTLYCTKYALPYILRSKGSVVGVSSIAGYKGLPARTGYSASKFAMQGFLEALRIEHLKTDLHVLIACPGFTASNIRNTALNKSGNAQKESPRNEDSMMTAAEVALYIKRAVEKKKDRLVLTRNGKLTVFLNKFFPRWLDKLVYNHFAKETNAPIS